MSVIFSILADLDLCVGCYSCEVACKQEMEVSYGTRFIEIVALGPQKIDGKLKMDFLPILKEGCNFCEHRVKEGLEPSCVVNCPLQALKFYKNDAELLSALQNGKRYQVCGLNGKVPAFG